MALETPQLVSSVIAITLWNLSENAPFLESTAGGDMLTHHLFIFSVYFFLVLTASAEVTTSYAHPH